MSDRLTPEREAELRTFVAGEHASFAWRELLDEIDALRAELADRESRLDTIHLFTREPDRGAALRHIEDLAEQRGRAAERADIVRWIRGLSRVGANAAKVECADSLTASIDSGAHVRKAGKNG